MAENYGTLEGTLDEHGVLSGEMNDRATLEGEIQFGSGGGGVLDVFQNGQSVVEGRYAYVTVPTFLKDLRADDYHNTVTTLEIQMWNGKADPSDIPENVTDLSDISVSDIQDGQILKWDATQEKFVNADESGGGGDVTDVQINDISVVDANGVAKIDLTPYAEKSDLGTASSKDVPATGNAGANEVVLGNDTRLSDSRPASDVSSWAKADSKPTYQYSEIQNTPSLGTAAAKDFDNSVIDGSSNLVTGDAVHDAIDNAVSGAYKHAGTKTCAELISSLLVRANAGNVYNMTDSGTTTSEFIEGAGLAITAGENVGVAKIDENTYKFDLLSGFVDTSNFITKSSTSGLVKNDGSIDTTSYQPTESGKGLSTNDYDNIAKGKVDALGTASTKNVPTSGDAGNNEVVLGNDTRLTNARPASDVSAWAKEPTKPSYTKSEVGLDNVDNTSDSTKKTNFTGSIASGDTGFTTGSDVYTALDGKADKVSGATNGNLAGLNGLGNLTDSTWSADKTTQSATGNPISISGLKANQLAVNPIITFEPIQAGSGTPSPVNQRPISGYDKVEVLSCGVNVWDEQWELGAYSATDGSATTSTNSIRSKSTNYILIAPNKSYYMKYPGGYNLNICFYDVSRTFISNQVITASGIITTPTTAKYIRFNLSATYGTTYGNNISINYPSTDTDYHTYNKATSISESLGQTVYGGSLDVRTGVLTVDRAILTLDGSETYDNPWNDALSVFRLTSKTVPKKADSSELWYISNKYIDRDYSGTPSFYNLRANNTEPYQMFAITNNGGNIMIKDTNYSNDIAAFKASLTANPLVICYELAIPFTIQLTPHEISLLKDYAYVSTNGTTIAFDYHNGELASLADVAQLSQTVEELDRPQERTCQINITSYNTSSNRYTIPFDGYITASLPSGTGYVRVTVYDHNEQTMGIYQKYAVSSGDEYYTVFVKKGMKAMVTASSGFSPTVTYRGMA